MTQHSLNCSTSWSKGQFCSKVDDLICTSRERNPPLPAKMLLVLKSFPGRGGQLDGSLPFASNSTENAGISCGQATCFGAGGYYYSVAGTGTTINATTCFETTDLDAQLTVYAGSCDDLQCMTGNDDFGSATSEGGNKGRQRLNRELQETLSLLLLPRRLPLRNFHLGCSSLTSSVSWEPEAGVDYFASVHACSSSF